MKKLFDRDFLGVLASVICLIHCLCLPWLLMISSAWMSSYLSTPWFHHLMLAIAMLIGLPVFIKSYLKYKSRLVLVLGTFGLAFTTYGTLQSEPCCPHPESTSKVQSNNIIETTHITEASECSLTCATEGASCNSGIAVNPESDNTLQDESYNLLQNKSDIEQKSLVAGIKYVPLGVILILLAHVLNFRHRRICKKTCCDTSL